jgi:hypothetical protein
MGIKEAEFTFSNQMRQAVEVSMRRGKLGKSVLWEESSGGLLANLV